MPKIKTPSQTPIVLRTIYNAAALGIRARVHSLFLRSEAALYDNVVLEKTPSKLVGILRSLPEYRAPEAPDASVVASTVKAQTLLAAADISAAWLPTPEASQGAWSLDFISLAASKLGCWADTGSSGADTAEV